ARRDQKPPRHDHYHPHGSHLLAEFDRYAFLISAHRTVKDAHFIIGTVRWLDARQTQLQSAMRTTPSGNWRQWRWIRAIWLRHGAPPLQAGARLVSQSPARLRAALVGDD